MSLRLSPWVFALSAFLVFHSAFAQKASVSSEPEKNSARPLDTEARDLVRDILSQAPTKTTSLSGVLKIRDAEGKRSQAPLKYTIMPEDGGWRGTYETGSTPWRGAERLIIIHRDNHVNQYIHSPAGGPGEAPKQPVKLNGDQAAIPFAGSDYWLSDLGMEFLGWPDQRIVRDAKTKRRQGRPCKVIESINPNPATTQYARVVAWLDAESGSPIYAEGFDAAGRHTKTFSLHGFTKANGHWQPKDLEMLTEQTDSKTQIEFTSEPPE